jgi:adenylylsulfate kinase
LTKKLIVLAGLPGAGKSTLARAIAPLLHAVVINKDTVRAALFPPEAIEYSAEQDDFVVDLMLSTAGYLFHKKPDRPVILDGRTFARSYQLHKVAEYAYMVEAGCLVIECVCSQESAIARIEAEVDTHIARNRTPDLYLLQRAAWQSIPEPKCVVNTDLPVEECAAKAVAFVTSGDIIEA